jgi:acyl-CoA thioester hydrolase
MRTHQLQVRVRYSETDQMGVVYHGNYLPYFEIGRVEWLREKGISYKELEERGIALPIASVTLNYKKPARYDDLLTIRTTFKSQEGVKLEFACEILNEAGDLLTTADFLLIFVSTQTGRPTPPPDYILNLLPAGVTPDAP